MRKTLWKKIMEQIKHLNDNIVEKIGKDIAESVIGLLR